MPLLQLFSKFQNTISTTFNSLQNDTKFIRIPDSSVHSGSDGQTSMIVIFDRLIILLYILLY
jgi:hypothetical protein